MTRRKRGEGSITKRPDGRYMVRVDLGRDELGKRKRLYDYADTEAEAVKALRRLHRRALRERRAAPGNQLPRTFGAWLDMWLEMVRTSREPHTWRRYETAVRVHIKPALGHMALDDIGPLQVQRFLDAKLRTLKPNTVRVLWTAITAALTRLEKLGGPPNLATSRALELPPIEYATENILDLAGARTFLDGIRDERLYALYLMAVVLGQRESSLLGLRWVDVAEDYSRVRLPLRLIRFERAWHLRKVSSSRTKKAPRSLPLPQPVADALRAHRTRQDRERAAAGDDWTAMEHEGKEVELVFTTRTGMPLGGQHVAERFHQCLKRAGLDKRRFHDLRHSAASIMLALDIPLETVSEVLAHAGIQITADLYNHLKDDVLRQQLAILDAAWGEGVG